MEACTYDETSRWKHVRMMRLGGGSSRWKHVRMMRLGSGSMYV